MSNPITFIKTRTLKQRLWKGLNTAVALATLLNVSMAWVWLPTPAQAAANPSANLDQCANDPAPSPHTDGCNSNANEWVNGNLGASKSVYLENDSVPYRMRFDNLSLASHTVTIEWDTTKSSKHAFDYLTTYNRTVADANPCLGVSGCGASTTFPIPVDPQVSGAGITQIPGNFTLFGGTITSVSGYSYANGSGFTGDKSARISITFTASAANPVLAWAGHISDRHDWGADNSAVSIPGSPYHMRLIDLDGSGGNQDRSLSADAVIFPASITIVKQASPEGSTSFGFSATPAPLTNFNLVDDGTIANTKVFSNLTDFKAYTVTESVPANWSLDSIVCGVTSPNGGSQNVTHPSVSINLKEGENVTCTYTNSRQAGLVTFQKIVVGGTAQPSDWSFTINGVPGTFYSGDSTTLPTGTYTVTESGPAQYSSTSASGICGNLNGNSATLTVTQQGGTCTFTNTRDTGDLKVIKHVVNDNGGNNTAGDFTMHIKQGGVDSVAPFAGSESGSTYTLNTGTYAVSETGSPDGYTQTSIVCDGQATDTITVVKGQLKVCTITNDDVSPSITLHKSVINDNGGNAGVNDFGLTIGGTPVTSGQTLNVNANTPIALNEAGLSGYTFVSLTGDAKCPLVLGGTVTLTEGEHVSCTITNDDVAPTITLIKNVINDNGGNAGANDFGLSIGGTPVTSGQTLNVDANTPYALNEVGLDGYNFVSLTGTGCPTELGGTATLNEGQNITCTITNDDVAPSITLIKSVINDHGGTAGVNDFGLTIGVTPVNSGQTLNVDANTPIAVNEAGLNGYAFVSLTGDAKCPQVLGGTVTLDEGEQVTCTITNNDIAPQLTVYKVVINDDGGTAIASDFTLNVYGTDVSPGTFPGNVNGTVVTLDAGNYEVTEDFFPGYTPVFGQDCTGSIDIGETKSCVVTNTDDTPHLIVVKHVINDNGGNNVASDFVMHVTGTDVSNSSFLGEEAGTTVSLDAGAYSVDEDQLTGYAASFSADCEGSITLGQTKVCTVTNNDIAPSITLNKSVINDNGGNAGVNDFGLTIGGTPVTSGQTLNVNANTPIALNEAGLSGYTFVSLTGDAKCPLVLGGTVTLTEGEHVSCTITNDDVAPTITLIKNVINDNGGDAEPSDFSLKIDGSIVTQGVAQAVSSNNPHSINEDALPGYAFESISDDPVCPTVLGGTVTLNEGQNITCTITNNDIAASLAVQKDGPATVQAGDQITYTITWQVLEPGFAMNATLVDTLPTNVTFVGASANSAVPVYDSGAGTVTWSLGTLAAPAGGSETITVQTNNPERNDTLVHNDVVFSSDDHQASDDHDTTIESDFEVQLDKSAPATVQAGDQLTFTLDWSVSGNSPIDSLILTDAIPANTSFVSASNGGVEAAGVVTWNLGAHLPGDSDSVTMTVQVNSPLADGTEIENTAEVCGETAGIEAERCDEGESITEVESDFVVTIEKSDNTDPVSAGGQIVYTLDWTVSGNTPIDNVTVTDTLADHTAFVSASDGGTEAAGVVTWNLGAIPSGNASGSLTLTVSVESPLANGTELENFAEICGQSLTQTEPEVIEHCDDDDETTTVESAPILSIEKTNSVAGFTNPGKNVTYTLEVGNAGNATDTAVNVIVTDVLPDGFTFQSSTPAEFSVVGQTVTWKIGDLAPGDSATIEYVVSISADQTAGTYTNTAIAEADNHGPVTDISDVQVRLPRVLGSEPVIEVTMDKVVNPTVTNPGKVVTYTLTITNTGDVDATNVTVTDTLPDGFTFIEGGKSVKTFVIGTLLANHTRVINYEVRVGNDVKAGHYKNTAILTADGLEPIVDQADVEVRVPKVLGLATTGVGLRDYIIFALGLGAIALGLYGLRRRKHDSIRA